jgi:hypothetical protein
LTKTIKYKIIHLGEGNNMPAKKATKKTTAKKPAAKAKKTAAKKK